MKFRRLVLIPFMMCSMLAACSSEEPTSEPSTSTSVPVDYSALDYPAIDFKEEDYICSGGSYGGEFIEVNVGRYLSTECTYKFMFKSSYALDDKYTISISNQNLATFEVLNKSNFRVTTTDKAGDFLMKIENAVGALVYRNVIHVRKAVPTSDLARLIFDVDSFKTEESLRAYIGSWRLSFTSTDPLVGALVGGDDMEQNVRIVFKLTYVEDAPEIDAYCYSMEIVSTNATTTKPVVLYIARCLDYIYIYEQNGDDVGLLTMLRP